MLKKTEIEETTCFFAIIFITGGFSVGKWKGRAPDPTPLATPMALAFSFDRV